MTAGTPDALRGALYGLGAAALFGASAPLAKLLLPATGPLVLSALLYLGSAGALTLLSFAPRGPERDARLRRSDLPVLAAVVFCGGVLGPILMLVGLGRVSGLSGALLLNLEAPFTILLAVAFFGEHLGRREALAALLVVVGALLLAERPGETRADWIGALAIAGACLSWGIDNNLSQRLSLRDPVAVVRIKSVGAGACTLAIALVAGHAVPGIAVVAGGLLLGAVSYGLSLVLDMRALRILGAAREAAYFATAPFLGALLAIPLLGDRPGAAVFAAAALMAAGIGFLVSERHRHPHTHGEIVHEHLHVHDEHHRHPHDAPVVEPHTHVHRHEPLTHDHPHLPDLHHRHRHE